MLVTQSCPTLCDPMDCQAPLSMEFPRQEYWHGLPFPSPGDLPDAGIESRCPGLQADCLRSELPRKQYLEPVYLNNNSDSSADCSDNGADGCGDDNDSHEGDDDVNSDSDAAARGSEMMVMLMMKW